MKILIALLSLVIVGCDGSNTEKVDNSTPINYLDSNCQLPIMNVYFIIQNAIFYDDDSFYFRVKDGQQYNLNYVYNKENGSCNISYSDSDIMYFDAEKVKMPNEYFTYRGMLYKFPVNN